MKWFKRFFQPRVIVVEKIVEVDPNAGAEEKAVRKLAEWTEKKYGITYEDLKSDFSPGKFLGGSELIFWEAYRHPKSPLEAPYEARERANVYSSVTKEEISKFRSEVKLRLDTMKGRVETAFKKAIDEFYQTGGK